MRPSNRPIHLLSVAVLAAALLAITAVAQRDDASLIVTDDLGTEVRLGKPAQRVVSLAPSAAECLFFVGAGKQVVGVVEYSDYPAGARRLPSVGTFSNPDVERIFALRPDLAVVAYGNPQALASRLRQRGVAVYVQNPDTVDEVFGNLADLAKLTGHTPEASAGITRLKRRLSSVQMRVQGRPAVSSAVIVSAQSPLVIAGAKSHIHDALRLAGGKNVAANLDSAYPTMSVEALARTDPETLFVPDSGATTLGQFSRRPGIRSTRAGKENRIHALTADLVMRPGPRLIDAIERMARLLHPGAFS